MRKNNLVLSQYRDIGEEQRVNDLVRKSLGDDLEEANIYYIPIDAEHKAKVMITVDKIWEHLSVSVVDVKSNRARKPTDDEIEFLRVLLFENDEIVLEEELPKNIVAVVNGTAIHKGNMVCVHLHSPVNKSLSQEAAIAQFVGHGDER